MEAALGELKSALQKACDSLDGPLSEQRVALLQPTDSLPDRSATLLASDVVDLLGKAQLLLQPPSHILADNFLAYINTKCLWAAVERGIPDHLAAQPRTLSELAALSDTQPLRLRQVLRILHNNGIFTYNAAKDEYSNTPASKLLRRDHWTQWHTWPDLYGNEFYDMARGIPEAIRTHQRRCAAQVEYKTDASIFQYFAERGLAAKLHRTLGAGAIAQAPGMIADYDWASVGDATILDIGGGGGDFLVSLLRAHPAARGAILELQSVVDLLKPMLASKFADVADRVTQLHVGDFTREVPAYEVYTMKWCLHDWTDDDVVRILANVRRAVVASSPRARLVIIESVLADGRSGQVARYGDITMMVGANGRERTAEDWVKVAEASGWKVHSMSPLRNAWPLAIDLRPA